MISSPSFFSEPRVKSAESVSPSAGRAFCAATGASPPGASSDSAQAAATTRRRRRGNAAAGKARDAGMGDGGLDSVHDDRTRAAVRTDASL